MIKKPFNWFLFIWIAVLVSGLSFVIYGLIQSIAYPDGKFVSDFFNGNSREGISGFIQIGVLWLFITGFPPPVFYKTYLRWRAFRDLPDRTEHAKVISKAFTTKESYVSEGVFSTSEQHFIAFELPDESRKNFAVKVDIYNTVLENETGLLTYKEQGNRLKFIDFQRQA